MELTEIADRLYALAPEEFTERRNAEAAEAKQAGRPELAAAIKSLRKPSITAWVVNHFARLGGGFGEVLELGEQLRAAQQALDGDQLRSLSRRRVELTRRLVADVAREAAEVGARLTDAGARDLSATLDAALTDPAAGAAIGSGRLVRALNANGFDPVDLDGAVAVPEGEPSAPTSRPRLRPVASAPARAVRPSRASVAQQALEAAVEKAAVAERAVVRVDAALDTADRDHDHARARVEEAEAELAAARRALAATGAHRTSVQRERSQAERRRKAAQRDLAQAQAAVK
jgi:hypothetical protein